MVEQATLAQPSRAGSTGLNAKKIAVVNEGNGKPHPRRVEADVV
jgi:hypothetical protein